MGAAARRWAGTASPDRRGAQGSDPGPANAIEDCVDGWPRRVWWRGHDPRVLLAAAVTRKNDDHHRAERLDVVKRRQDWIEGQPSLEPGSRLLRKAAERSPEPRRPHHRLLHPNRMQNHFDAARICCNLIGDCSSRWNFRDHLRLWLKNLSV